MRTLARNSKEIAGWCRTLMRSSQQLPTAFPEFKAMCKISIYSQIRMQHYNLVIATTFCNKHLHFLKLGFREEEKKEKERQRKKERQREKEKRERKRRQRR